jgi:hypothetical protein
MRIAIAALTLVASVVLSSSAMAQDRALPSVSGPESVAVRHIVAPAQMHQAIVAQAAVDQQNRDALLGAMRRADVRDLADQLGLNLTRAEGAVAALDSAELARLSAPIRGANVELTGGANTIVISTTTLILVLIIVILLVR